MTATPLTDPSSDLRLRTAALFVEQQTGLCYIDAHDIKRFCASHGLCRRDEYSLRGSIELITKLPCLMRI